MTHGSQYLEVLCSKPFAAAGGASTTKGKTKRLTVDWKSKFSLAAARKLLPQGVKGCTIQKWVERRAWVAFYPDVTPASRHRTWGKYFTENAVLKHCLRWAWAHHTKRAKEVCPYNL